MTQIKKIKKIASLKLLNFTSYNEPILTLKGAVWFQSTEEAKTKDINYRDARLAWTKLSRNIDSTTGVYKTIIHKKFAK